MSEQAIASLNNAASGHGDDWGFEPKPISSRDWADIAPPYAPWRDISVDNLSTAADHGRMSPLETLRTMTPSGAKLVKSPVEYKSHNLTIYYRPNSMMHDHLVTSGDWNV